MKIRMVFIDGSSLICDNDGEVLSFTYANGEEGDMSGGFPSVCGIWHDENECTIPLAEVMDYKNTDFHLTSGMFLDNGQVMDEGEIASLEILDVVEWRVTSGGCDTSGWKGTDDNVYCEDCNKSYLVKASEYPRFCCMCGGESLILREEVEEDIGAIQSELAREYSKKLRSEAPWILGGDE